MLYRRKKQHEDEEINESRVRSIQLAAEIQAWARTLHARADQLKEELERERPNTSGSGC